MTRAPTDPAGDEEEPPSESDREHPANPARGGRRPWWRRILRGVALLVAALLMTAVGLVLLLLYAPAFDRLLIQRGIAAYDAMIPGGASLEGVEGALGRRLELRGLELRDRAGRSLVSVDRLAMGLDVPRALGGRLSLGVVEIAGVDITLIADEAGGFGDLAPPGEPRPPPPPPPLGADLGPTLPLGIELALKIEDLRVRKGPDAEGSPGEEMVALHLLELRAEASGTAASLELELAVDLPVADDLRISRLGLRARWDDPVAVLEELSVDSSWGALALGPLEFDLRALEAKIEELRLSADPAWFEEQAQMPAAAAPSLELRGQGDPLGLDLDLRAHLPGRLDLRARIRGALEPELDLRLSLDLGAAPDQLVPSLLAPQVTALVDARLRGDPGEQLDLGLDIHCSDCDPGGVPVTLTLRGGIDVARRDAHARLYAAFAGAELHGQAAALEGRWVGARVDLEAPRLDRVADLAGNFVPRPDLAGAAALRLECAGTLDPRDLGCELRVDLDRGRPVSNAGVDLGATLQGEELAVALRRLDLRALGVRIAHRGEPALLTHELGSTALGVRGLDLLVDPGLSPDGAGRGRLRIDGAIDPQGSSDLALRLDRVQLSLLDRFVPGLGLSGRVGLDAAITGPGAAPRVHAHLRGRQLALRGEPLGRLDLRADVEAGSARLRLDQVDGPAGQIELRAELPMDLDLEAGVVGPRSGPWSAALRIRGAALDRLARLAPPGTGPLPMGGAVDLEVDLRGGARPVVEAGLRARELRYGDEALGGLELAARYQKGTLDAALDLHHRDVARARVEATVPLALDLRLDAPAARWRAQADHRLQLRIDRADLRAASAWLPELGLEGMVDFAFELGGGLDTPELDARLRAGGLRLDGKSIGDLRLELGYREAELRAALRGSSPLARRIELDARVPVELAPLRAGSPVAWRSRSPHTLRLGVDGADLRALRPWVPDLPPIDGRATLLLELEGTGEAPRPTLSLSVSDLQVEGDRLADLGVTLGYDAGLAKLDLLARHDAQRRVELHAEIPLDLDPPRGEIAWARDRPHRLDIELRGADSILARRFAELPEGLDFDLSLDLAGRGNAGAFDLHSSFGGDIELEGVRQPLGGELAVAPDEQTLSVTLGGGPAGSLGLEAATQLPLGQLIEDAAPVPLADAGVELALRIDALALELLAPLLPEELHDPRGRFDAAVDVSGTLGTPRFDGEAALSGGEITVVSMRQRFRDMGLELDFDQDGAALRRFALRAGQGGASASGQIKIGGQGIDADLRLDVEKMPFERPGIPRMAIDSQIATRLHAAPGEIEVDVDIQGTRVDVRGTNVAAPRAIPEAEVVVFVDQSGAMGSAEEDAAATAEEDAAAAVVEAVGRTRVLVQLSEPLVIRGPAIDMAWDGKVELELGPAGATTTGALSNVEGRFDLLSNEFRVKRGEVTIPPGGDVVPFIDLEATTQIEDYEITATIKGRVTRPTFRLTSVPAADEATIFGMLVSGTATPDEGPNTAKQAASILAAFSSPALQRQLNDKLKVDKVGLSFGETAAQPILSVGKNLSKRVYVETRYQFGADPTDPTRNKAEVGLRYRFRPKWSLETYFGDAPAGGAGVFWGNAYDIRVKPYWIVPRGAAPVPAAAPGDDGPGQDETPGGETSAPRGERSAPRGE